jgi:two-component system sensor histidine kinase BaeS
LEGGAHRNPKLHRDLLQGMEGEIRIMRKLIDEIAHLYGRTLGPLELNRVETSPNEWLPRVLAPWREAARSKRLRFETDIPEGLPGIRIDPDRMEQALGNLLSNAVKFTPHGRIAFRVRTAGDSICLEVADTGPGIPAEELPRIFLPFHRGSTGGRFPRGMGLGLSIARDIAEAHGGTLEARNESGRGAVFSLILPLHAPATTSDAAS